MGQFYVSATNSLGITSNTYSLQDAISPNSYDSTQPFNGHSVPYLFDTGCQVDGVQNCTAACRNAGSAFRTLETLHNCMMYPIIADQLFKDNLSIEIAQLAQTLGIEKEQWPSSPVSLNITTTIDSCLDAYCSTLPDCTEAAYQYNLSYYHATNSNISLNQTTGFYFDLDPYQEHHPRATFDLCEYLPVSINQDIGGIGVRHSDH